MAQCPISIMNKTISHCLPIIFLNKEYGQDEARSYLQQQSIDPARDRYNTGIERRGSSIMFYIPWNSGRQIINITTVDSHYLEVL